jgi:tetratricopeptide (TPR) repeat protein
MRAALENGSGTTEPPDYRRFRISLMTRAAEMLVKSATPETGLSFFNETFPEDRGESQVGESRVYLIVRLAEEWKNRRAYQAAYLASRDGLLRYPDNRLLQAAKTAIVHEWATSLAPQDAGATLTALAARHAEPVFLTALVRNVLLEADRLQRANRREEAIRLLEGLLENTALPAAETKTVRGMLSTALHNRAVELIRAGLYDEAILFLESARRTFPDDRDLATLLAGAFHNHGLSLLQAGQNSLARNVVARGLEIFPDDRALLRLQKSLQSD